MMNPNSPYMRARNGFATVPAAPRAQLDAQKRASDPVYQNAISSGKYQDAMPIDPVTGRPLLATWTSMLDDGGALKEQYKITDQGNTQALDKYRAEALRDPATQSAWAKLMNDQISSEQTIQMDAGNQAIANNRAGMFSDLAQTGGLGTGARERMMRNAGRESLLSKQRTLRDAATNRGNIAIKDEENRQNMLGQTVNMDQSRTNYLTDIQKTNNSNLMNEVSAGRDYKQNMWNKEMESWAAGKQADAQRSASCFSGEMLVAMSDGSRKEIKDVQVGDDLLLGGIVLQTIKTLKDWRGDVYEYMGVIVTGTHAVLEGEEFVRVKDSKKAKLSNQDMDFVYNLTTKNHIMILGNTVFGDYQETAHDDLIVNLDLSLKRLNENFRPALA